MELTMKIDILGQPPSPSAIQHAQEVTAMRWKIASTALRGLLFGYSVFLLMAMIRFECWVLLPLLGVTLYELADACGLAAPGEKLKTIIRTAEVLTLLAFVLFWDGYRSWWIDASVLALAVAISIESWFARRIHQLAYANPSFVEAILFKTNHIRIPELFEYYAAVRGHDRHLMNIELEAMMNVMASSAGNQHGEKPWK